MFSLNHVIYGLLAAAIGIAGVKYTFQLVNFTGRQDWIENILGEGTTYVVFKTFFLAVVLGGILYATGFGDSIMNFLLGPLKKMFTGLKR